jgi:hypothetical protein
LSKSVHRDRLVRSGNIIISSDEGGAVRIRIGEGSTATALAFSEEEFLVVFDLMPMLVNWND